MRVQFLIQRPGREPTLAYDVSSAEIELPRVGDEVSFDEIATGLIVIGVRHRIFHDKPGRIEVYLR